MHAFDYKTKNGDWLYGSQEILGIEVSCDAYSHFVDTCDIYVDFDDENEMNNAIPVPTSSEMRNVMKSMRSYLEVRSNGEINNKTDDIEQCVDN
ncbi:hypothetical protein TNCV_1524471 [Trichonephila clavipes]|nr:hypothetical protein TNCV_1524471 [Trichonephila clavipes]